MLPLQWSKHKVTKESITYTAPCLFFTLCKTRYQLQIFKTVISYRLTNKLNFPACFLPKLSLRPPFLTYEGAQTFSVVRFFLHEVYQRRKQVLLSLRHTERIPFSRYGYSQLPDQGSSKLSNWARVAQIFSITNLPDGAEKCTNFKQLNTSVHFPEGAVGAENGISTPENSILRSRSPASRYLTLDNTIFYCFICLFFFSIRWFVFSSNG